MWLDYSDQVQEGKWVDHNGKEEVYINWAERPESQPNGGNNENYAVLNMRSDEKREVSDEPNDSKYPYYCTKPCMYFVLNKVQNNKKIDFVFKPKKVTKVDFKK